MLDKLKALLPEKKSASGEMSGMEGQTLGDGDRNAEMTLAEEAWDLAKTVLLAVAIVMVFRIIFFQPFNIPTGSMKPGMLVGDFIVVSKFDYGYSRASLVYPFTRMGVDGRIFASGPDRGEVVVFKNSRDKNKDYIKRVIGLPGDRVQTIGGVLHINGQRVEREFIDDDTSNCRRSLKGGGRYLETLPGGTSYVVLECLANRNDLDNVGPFLVPAGHYFMMGDNRDDSLDSRTGVVGMVPADQIVGKAQRIVFSVDGSKSPWWQIWNWPFMVRYSRIFDPVG